MNITELGLKGVFLIEPKVFGDDRGYFFESFNQRIFEQKTGVKTSFVQDNESFSSYGVLRGLHFQKPPFAQAKLVRVVKGRVLDVAVDLRSDSETFGHHVAVELNEEKKNQLFVPRGFGHGFIVLSEQAIFSYKVDNDYAPEHDSGIMFNDADLNINWKIPIEDLVVSQKDQGLQSFSHYKTNTDF